MIITFLLAIIKSYFLTSLTKKVFDSLQWLANLFKTRIKNGKYIVYITHHLLKFDQSKMAKIIHQM